MKHAGWASLLVLLAAGTGRAQGQEKPLLPQRPAISRTHIAFNLGGDLWIVGREGGEARRLTSDVGLEFGPIFSPDGALIAFTGEYDGNVDVFVVPAAGGEPRRLTWHPGPDVAVGWTPDGRSILFSSPRASTSRFNKLFTLPVEGGGLPSELPLPMGEEGAFSPDGRRIAYVPFWNRRALPTAYVAWKRYRGGKASPIWIADLADSRIVKVPREDSNDFCPMWVNGKLYFLSDRDSVATLFSVDPQTNRVRRELEPAGDDLLFASAGPDAIVYEQIGALHTFDLKTATTKRIDVRVTGDFPGTRPRLEKVGKKIVRMAVSPSGARVAAGVRGEILSIPAEKGDVRNLTQTPGAAERNPSWSPDGKTLAYFSDESGEYQLHLRDDRGGGGTRRIALGDAPNFYSEPAWSSDGKRISYSDNRMQLWILDVATGQSTRVDGHTYFTGSDFDAVWSPDGRWLAYTKLLSNRLFGAFLYDTSTGRASPVTDGMSDVRSPAFDRSGKYLYFAASTDIGPTTTGIDMSAMNRPVTRSLYLAVLSKDVASPLAPESDEEKDKEKPVEKKEEKEPATRIDLENIGQRILALPLPARNYTSLQAGKAGNLFIVERPLLPSPASPEQPARGDLAVQKFDLATRKAEKVIDGITSFELAAHGEKMLVQQSGKWYLAAAGAAAKLGESALKTDDLEVRIDPRAEWRQMYRETWRLQRDFLYDRNAHGLDLAAAEKRFSVFLDGLVHRTDLNYLFNEMLGHLVLGHTYISGGDTPEVRRVKGGLLGADLRIENGRYRFERIYSGENWNPQLRAPLTQPGVNVREGDYLLSVDGRELKGGDNLYAAFEATAGKSVTIRIGPSADGKDARDAAVVPVETEVPLRNLAWIESNRRKVGELTQGRVAYVYLPDTGSGGYANFNRYFFAQVDKEALVIDERFNGGGKAADYIIDYLRRPLLNYWTAREGRIYTTPGGAIFGPKVMIVNEYAGSGGDAMPWYFRKAGIGTLVGKRTWGGLVGISGYPPLLDGGSVTAPSFAFFSPDGTWDVENRGVAPDVEVEHDPQLVRAGRDPQLEKAVEIVMKKLAENPVPQPKKPAYPNYHLKNGGR